MAQQKRGKQTSTETKIVTDTYMVAMIRSLLANMIGDTNRYFEMDDAITYKDLPEDMPFERDVLRVIEDISARNHEPTREHVLMGLRTMCNRTENSLEQDLDTLIEMQTEGGGVRTLAHFVWQAARTRHIHEAVQVATKKVLAPIGDVEENLNHAVEMLSSVMKEEDLSEQRSDKELGADYIREILEQRIKTREGGIQYPSLKYKGFTGEYDDTTGEMKIPGKIPVLQWGQSTLISALPGHGKTAIGADLAEYNAWYLGHDVLYIHLETDQAEMMDRSISRNLKIPMDYLQKSLDIRYVRQTEDSQNIHSHVAYLVYNFSTSFMNLEYKKLAGMPRSKQSSGEIIYKFCPGWNSHRIVNLIKGMRRRSEQRGRGLVVFVDYYNLIDYSVFSNNRAEGLGRVALELRNCIKSENLKSPVYMFLFAQENTDDTGRAYAYASREIEQYVQVYISIQREVAEVDEAYTRKGVQQTDALGYPRYWHRKGGYKSDTILRILKANNGQTGDVPVKIESAFFRVEDSR